MADHLRQGRRKYLAKKMKKILGFRKEKFWKEYSVPDVQIECGKREKLRN